MPPRSGLVAYQVRSPVIVKAASGIPTPGRCVLPVVIWQSRQWQFTANSGSASHS